MSIKTILNRCHPIRYFVYGAAQFVGEQIHVVVRARAGSLGHCGGCGGRGPTYDTSRHPRLFEFVPLWGYVVFLVYRMRRIDCSKCGVRTEQVPWADGKNRCCNVYRLFLARWARRVSWSQVALIFGVTWGVVNRAIRWVVEYGLLHRDLGRVTAIGVDEIAVWKGHKYLTVSTKSIREIVTPPDVPERWHAGGRRGSGCPLSRDGRAVVVAVDTNVLVYAADADSPFHAACRDWLETQRRRADAWFTTWAILYEFMRVTTHARVMRRPWSAREAWEFIAGRLASPGLGVLVPTERHAQVAAQVLTEIPHLSGNVFHNARTAILMREHGIRRIVTRDTDFHRFPFLEPIDPVA